jgi:protein ImuB
MVACLVCESLDETPNEASGRSSSETALEMIARACSPRVEPHGPRAVIFDVDGLSRVCGPPDVIAREVTALAAAELLRVRVALAATRTAAWILAHACRGTTVVASGKERDALAPLPVGWLGAVEELDQVRSTKYKVRSTKYEVRREMRLTADGVRFTESASDHRLTPEPFKRGRKHVGGRGHHYRLAPGPAETKSSTSREPHAAREPSSVGRPPYADLLSTFARWGVRTCQDVAALPRADIHARMGPPGVLLHQAACGEDVTPLTPADEVVPFADRMELDWPIEGLEPLSFVLTRQFDRLSNVLEHADRGAVTVTTRLTLTTREVHERVLNLPAPMRDARVLRTLVLLDLESHPPTAGVDVIEVVLGVTPGRIVQGSLLTRSLPSPEDIATLVARLGALMGESRIGSPVLLDTYDTRPVAMKPFRVHRLTNHHPSPVTSASTEHPEPGTPNRTWNPEPGTLNLVPGFRRFPLPISAHVTLERGMPAHVASAARGLRGAVIHRAGPWRTSGEWWALESNGWDRDQWDVQLADGVVYRLARHRRTGAWDIEGIFD